MSVSRMIAVRSLWGDANRLGKNSLCSQPILSNSVPLHLGHGGNVSVLSSSLTTVPHFLQRYVPLPGFSPVVGMSKHYRYAAPCSSWLTPRTSTTTTPLVRSPRWNLGAKDVEQIRCHPVTPRARDPDAKRYKRNLLEDGALRLAEAQRLVSR